MASFGAEFYVVTLLMHDVHHYSALMAGVAFLPLAATAPLGSAVTGRLTRTFGALPTLVAGFAIGAAGVAPAAPDDERRAVRPHGAARPGGQRRRAGHRVHRGVRPGHLGAGRTAGRRLGADHHRPVLRGSVGLAVLVSVMGETPSGSLRPGGHRPAGRGGPRRGRRAPRRPPQALVSTRAAARHTSRRTA
ncbi:hypothetical protein LT493_10370 [Streptomyces tricolor]|nr:hypothetical protein [Streptomyces tricolor]